MVDDLRLALRRLRNAPGFTVIAILTLALAVGANTAIFTVADAVLFRPLPYEDPDRLFVVRLVHRDYGSRSSSVPYEYVAAIQRHHSGVEAVALRSNTTMLDHAGAEGGESIETFSASPDYFGILGVRSVRGRLFDESDISEGHRRVILSYESWQSRFGGDESIVGRDVRLGTIDRTVIGVLPPAFIFPSASLRYGDLNTGRAEFAMVAAPPVPSDPQKTNSIARAGFAFDAIVRLRPGVSREQAQAELDVLMHGVPRRPTDVRSFIALDDLRSLLFPTGRSVLVLLLVSAGLVLLIGCANLANMLIARTHRREREIAVHAALGATRVRLLRPLFVEAAVIGAAASVLAVAVTALASDAILREVPPAAYGRAFIGVDVRVAAFAMILGTCAGLVFAVVPAWRASRLDVQALFRRGASRGYRRGLGRPMIAAQVALAILVVVGAVTAGREFLAVVSRPIGFTPENVIGVRVYNLRRAGVSDFHRRLYEALSARPDVVAVGAASSRPFDRVAGTEEVEVGGQRLPVVHVLPGYFEALGMQLREGGFPASNISPTGLEPVVVTKSAALLLFQGRPAVGQIVSIGTRGAEVTGVVNDVVTDFNQMQPWLYLVPREFRATVVVVKTRTRSARTLSEVRRTIAGFAEPTSPVIARWIEDSIGANSGYRNPRFQSLVLGGFGVLALVLAALGIFAFVAATVAARTREMGIRIAVGASPLALVRLVVRDASVPIVCGIVAGVAGTALLRRFAESQLAGLQTMSFGALGAAIGVVITAGLLAAYLPARRASRVDPIVVLRTE